MRFVIGMTLVAGLVLLTACGGGDDAPARTDVTLTFSEWEIAVEPSRLTEGEVTFSLTNEGIVPHNLVIIKSDLPPAELPVSENAVDKGRLNVVGGAGPVAPGTASPADEGYTLRLSAGKYILLCDVVAGGESHYRNGMYASMLVEP